MTVEDLLEELRQFPLTARVMLATRDSEFQITRLAYEAGEALIEIEYDEEANRTADLQSVYVRGRTH